MVITKLTVSTIYFSLYNSLNILNSKNVVFLQLLQVIIMPASLIQTFSLHDSKILISLFVQAYNNKVYYFLTSC